MRFTIHQPLIFPPIYLFARFVEVEKLVLIGTDWAKNSGWHTRFKLGSPARSILLSVPLSHRFGKRINEVKFADSETFFFKFGRTTREMYGRLKYYEEVMALVDYRPPHNSLWNNPDLPTFGQYCTQVIKRIAVYLKLPLDIIEAEELLTARPVPSTASMWLAMIGEEIGGTEYVCAEDATLKYLDADPFVQRNIALTPQRYIMPPTMSAEDATTSVLSLLFRYSPERVVEILKGRYV